MKRLTILTMVVTGLFLSSLTLNVPANAQENPYVQASGYAEASGYVQLSRQANPLLDQNFWGKYDSGEKMWFYATAASVAEVIEDGADIYAKDEYGWAPLHYAARAGTEEAVWTLLAAMADKESAINTPDKDKLTPLYYAARWNDHHPNVVRLLLNQGAEVDIRDKDDYTPLLVAAKWNTNPQAVQAFLDLDAKMIEFAGGYGMTALHYAAANNAPEVVELLLNRGAKVNAWSSLGKPLELARQFNQNPEVEELLLEYSAWD